MKTYHTIHAAAILGGTLAVFSNMGSDLQWGYEQSGTWLDSNNAIIASLSIGSLVASGAVGAAISSNRTMVSRTLWSFGLIGVWLICSTFSLAVSTDRIASARDKSMAAKAATSEARTVTEKLVEHAEARVNKWCATRRGKVRNHVKCKRWTKTADRERQLLENYRESPDLSPDSLGPRIARVAQIFGHDMLASDVNVVVPLMAPLGLLMLGSILLAFGMAGERVEPEFDVPVDDVEERAKRMIEAFLASGKRPTIMQVSTTIGVGKQRARRMIKEYA